MSKVLVLYFDVSFLLDWRFENWKMKRKSVAYIWEYQQKTKQEKAKERLESFCKFKGYEIIDYYQDDGISAKTGN